MVARKVRDSLPLKLFTQWRASINGNDSPCQNNSISGGMNFEETASVSVDEEWSESLCCDENEKIPEMYLPLKQSFLKAFKLMDKELKLHPTIDCFCSGTTAVTVIKQVISCGVFYSFNSFILPAYKKFLVPKLGLAYTRNILLFLWSWVYMITDYSQENKLFYMPVVL